MTEPNDNVKRMNEYCNLQELARNLRQNALRADDVVDNVMWIAAGGRGTRNLIEPAETMCRPVELLEEWLKNLLTRVKSAPPTTIVEMTEFDHSVREGAMLRRRHEEERTEVLLEVVSRFEDIDDGHYEYELLCSTHTGYYQCRDEDLKDCFADTGFTTRNSRDQRALPEAPRRARRTPVHRGCRSKAEGARWRGVPPLRKETII